MNEEPQPTEFCCHLFRMIEYAQDPSNPDSEHYRDKVYEYCNDIGGEE